MIVESCGFTRVSGEYRWRSAFSASPSCRLHHRRTGEGTVPLAARQCWLADGWRMACQCGQIPVCIPWGAIPMGYTPGSHRGQGGVTRSRLPKLSIFETVGGVGRAKSFTSHSKAGALGSSQLHADGCAISRANQRTCSRGFRAWCEMNQGQLWMMRSTPRGLRPERLPARVTVAGDFSPPREPCRSRQRD